MKKEWKAPVVDGLDICETASATKWMMTGAMPSGDNAKKNGNNGHHFGNGCAQDDQHDFSTTNKYNNKN